MKINTFEKSLKYQNICQFVQAQCVKTCYRVPGNEGLLDVRKLIIQPNIILWFVIMNLIHHFWNTFLAIVYRYRCEKRTHQ